MSERDPTVTLRYVIEHAVLDLLPPIWPPREWLDNATDRAELARDIAYRVLQKLADDNIVVLRR